ncbi:MAG: hypothetical protein RBG13Loki_3081 [Promethearchaeota archaeon CR_4]|nr:MAG: hypothetical protein RBG13Loki_3081 [Candidatus Lokiarchaeota archaeon CR_4]
MNTAFQNYDIDLYAHKIRCIELILASITQEEPTYNPRIMACGIVTSNLSDKSLEDFDVLSNKLTEIYQDVKINKNTMNGDLRKVVIV